MAKASVSSARANRVSTTRTKGGSESPRSAIVHRVMLGSSIVIGTVGIVLGVLYYNEGPLRTALRHEAAHQPEEASRWVEYYLMSNPNDSRALALKARLLVMAPAADAPLRAIEIFDRVGPATIDDSHAWGVAYMRTEQWSRAVSLLNSVVEQDPLDPYALYELTTCRIRLGMLTEALESAIRYTEISSDKSRGLHLQSAINNDMGNIETSIELHRSVLELNPDATNLMISPSEFFIEFGTILGMAGLTDESIQMLTRAARLHPSASVLCKLGLAYSDAGEVDKAMTVWKQTLKLDTHNLVAREGLARLQLEMGRPEQGIELVREFENRNGLNSSMAYLLQRLYATTGNDDESAKWTDRAEELRKVEERRQMIEHMLLKSPTSYWSTIVRIHQFASSGNWKQADDLLSQLPSLHDADPFVVDLAKAVRDRVSLPSLDQMPLKHF